MQVVLNATDPVAAPFLAYLDDPTGSVTLPFACEIDIAVAIQQTSTLPGFAADTVMRSLGLVVSYADPRVVNGSLVCRDAFYSTSGNVSCVQSGYDGGIAQQDDVIRVNASGDAVALPVGQYCLGTGASPNELEENERKCLRVPMSSVSCLSCLSRQCPVAPTGSLRRSPVAVMPCQSPLRIIELDSDFVLEPP